MYVHFKQLFLESFFAYSNCMLLGLVGGLFANGPGDLG